MLHYSELGNFIHGHGFYGLRDNSGRMDMGFLSRSLASLIRLEVE